MLFALHSLQEGEIWALDRIAKMRRDLRRYVVENPRRWSGLLARMTRAKAIRGSNSIEGINVSQEDAIAAIDGEDPAEADRPTWQAIVGYRNAMDFILQRSKSENFRFNSDIILAVHFMITQHDLAANPGSLRPGWVCVRNSITGAIVHEGIDRDSLEAALYELIEYLNSANDEPAIVKAAMAHLNMVMMHPFSDGNGRAARCLQTAVLANEGIVTPTFSSIEEYIGVNWESYYEVLAEVGDGGWNPERDARPWIRFCITAHYRQAQTLLRRSKEFERVYEELYNLIRRDGLHERMTLALIEAAFGFRVRNSSYRVATEISVNLASRDLKILVDRGLLIPTGERRGRHYTASEEIQKIRQKHRMAKADDSPFAPPESDETQPSLFE